MNYQNKPKAELIKELKKLQQEFDSLKISFEKDITQSKKLEEALEFSRFSIDNAADAMAIIDYDGCFIDVNNAFCRSVGYSREQLLSMTVHDIDPLYPAVTWSVFWEKLKKTGSLTFESVHLTKEGKLTPVEINVNFFEYEGKEYHCGFVRDITERKRVESSLKQALEWKEAIFEGSRDAVFISDQDSCFVAVNNAASYLTGYSREQLLKMRIPDIHDIPDLDAYKIYHQRIFDGEEILSEAKILRSDGVKIDMEFNNRCVSIAGKPYMHTTARNITERKQAENILRFQSKILQNMNEGIQLTRISDAVIVYANPCLELMFGYQKDELINKNVSILNAPTDKKPEEVASKIRNILKQTGIWSGEIQNIRKDGSTFWCRVNISTFNHPEYGVIWISVHEDITSRKLAEEALHVEKENFRHSLDDSPLGVRICTIEGDTIYANKTLLEFYGYKSLEELQQTPLQNRYSPESYLDAQKRKKQRIKGDFSHTQYEINIIRKDGEIRQLQVFRKEVLWDGVRQFQVICNDITERKQAEEEIRISKELLEDLHKHLNDMRENERASISREIHDLLGQSLTALKLDLNRMRKYINTNPEAVTRLESIIELVSNTIKDVQRISSDLRPGILDELGLASAIEWYCEEFERRTDIKCNLKLDNSDFSDTQINLVFFRVLQETLTNVIRHAKASSVSIKLHQSDRGVTMSIKDNGIGITKEQIESYRSLGLISMRERVKQFNGTIDISSKKDSGTKLTFFIPAVNS